jgi:hypothetical protein
MENLLTEPVVSIHSDTHIGLVTLRVFNLDCALKFYKEILCLHQGTEIHIIGQRILSFRIYRKVSIFVCLLMRRQRPKEFTPLL